MKNYIIAYWKIILLFGIVGLIGGYFLKIYQFNCYSLELQQQLLETGTDINKLSVKAALQSFGKTIIFSAIGIYVSKQIELWKDKKVFNVKSLIISISLASVGGIIVFILDRFLLRNFSETMINLYEAKLSLSYIISTVIYCGIIEEIIFRLFILSFIAFILHKMFEKDKQDISIIILIIANILSAMLFSASHMLFEFTLFSISFILLRCILLDFVFGLLFGEIYRRYGIWYCIIVHIISYLLPKLLWML